MLTVRIPRDIREEGRSPSCSSPPPRRSLLPLHFPFRHLAADSMAPIRRFSSKEKGKVPLDEPIPLPPKKRLHRRRGADEGLLVARPWVERPPPGFPARLLPRARDAWPEDVAPHTTCRARSRVAVAVRPAGAQLHAEGSSRELILWAAVAPRSWIRLPRSFAMLMPPRGPVKMRLQHAGCPCRASVADVEVVSSSKVFMTCGWGEIARA